MNTHSGSRRAPLPAARLLALVALGASAASLAQAQIAAATQAQGSAPVTIVGPLPLPVTGTVNGTTTVLGTVTTRDADNPARQPFQVQLCTSVGPTSSCGATPTAHTVSANRRLVIEYASGRCPPAGFALSTGADWAALLQTTAGGTTATHLLHTVPGIAIGAAHTVAAMTLNGFNVAQLVRIYADPASQVVLDLDVGGLGNTSIACKITLSGYTVSM